MLKNAYFLRTATLMYLLLVRRLFPTNYFYNMLSIGGSTIQCVVYAKRGGNKFASSW